MIVLDASAVIELVLNTPVGRSVSTRIDSESVSLHAPDVLDLELEQVLRRLVRQRIIDETRGTTAIEDYLQLGISRHKHEILLPRIWELRDNITAYDAAYVALAEALDAPLLTLDERLSNTLGHRATIELVT